MRQPRVTVRDVADAAQVSVATASRALSGKRSVDPELVRRVLDASAQLGYSANVIARALRTQRTGTVGVVVPAINNPYFIGAVEALEQALSETQRSIMLCDAREDARTEAQRLDLLVNHMVDGLVVIPSSAARSRPALKAAAGKVPVVQFDRYVDSTGTDFVGSDNAEGLRQMVEHLRATGCRRFAYVGAKPTISSAAERLEAFRKLVAPGERRSKRWELLGEFTTEWGIAAGTELLAGSTLPDAIVCGADVIAIGLLTVLRDAGIAIPEQVKVASYDDLVLDRVTTPRLSSVRQPLEAMAREAVRLLDDRARGYDGPPRRTIFTPQLVVRESSAAA